jgi:hypothetical protein
VTPDRAGALAREIGAAGAVAGIAGGALMAALALLNSAAAGAGFWTPMRSVAATILGVNAFLGGAGAVLLGLAIHFSVAIVWGVLFTLVVPRDMGKGAALACGIGAGLFIFLLMTFLVVPWADPVMRATVDRAWGAWLVEHLVFGMCLALAPALRRRFVDRRAVAE